MKVFFRNEEGVSSLIEYIMLSVVCVGFFAILFLNSTQVFLDRPNEVVVEDEFTDIGNMMSTMITDMYVILPSNGQMETEYRIPALAGTGTYHINADAATSDQIIEVISYSTGKKVRVTIGGIASTMPINGTAQSSSTEHMISYDSTR
ncbi:hypothetical protein HWN40_00100 [Methanolobus zinderi]|jgi:hypothetical protein|uniref:Class III signal peptide-containing protein n=1 Tax=Methanolobus zinderi TaxID=536044 RepID=A0A7D5IAE7_9EURY|nr:hypothetical protein [Methanolobus zinderi]QLC48789.1 hypothetical protein HWN40_00100 [Methanolobus zinderi]